MISSEVKNGAEDRQKKIKLLIATHGQVSVDNLVQEFSISRETARRDLMEMERDGLLLRIRCGAISLKTNYIPCDIRITQRLAEKRAICSAALQLIQEGDTIFLDAGSTSTIMAKMLTSPRAPIHLTIITNSFDNTAILTEQQTDLKTTLRIIHLSGEVKREPMETFGDILIENIHQYQADIALLSPWSIHADKGAMNRTICGANIARAMIKNANRKIILADHSKIGTMSIASFCATSEIDHLIVDKKATKNAHFENLKGAIKNIIITDK